MQTKASGASEVPLHEILADVLAGDPAGGGFEVHYQPIVRFTGGATVAVEALACWEHPAVGKVEPNQFMSAAEHTGLTGVLEDFLLNQACADPDALTAAYGLDVPVHVNVSASRLVRPDLHAAIDWALRRYKLAASRLVIEISDAGRTEAMSQAVLDICRRIGLSVIALGIATARQATALQGMGCELGQGDLYGPPLRLQRVAKKRA